MATYAMTSVNLTEAHNDLNEEGDDENVDGESLRVVVEAHHPVEDADEDHGDGEEDGNLGDLFADVVHVRPVHPIKVFTEKYWQFGAKDLAIVSRIV